jgi:hypothetical protein
MNIKQAMSDKLQKCCEWYQINVIPSPVLSVNFSDTNPVHKTTHSWVLSRYCKDPPSARPHCNESRDISGIVRLFIRISFVIGRFARKEKLSNAMVGKPEVLLYGRRPFWKGDSGDSSAEETFAGGM